MNRWQIGDVRITRFVEMETVSKGTFLLPDATLENVQRTGEWLRPQFVDETGRLRMSIHAYLIESRGRRIIVDTCLGNDKKRDFPGWNMLQTSFLSDLAQGGFPRESIDLVICTHLHVDHVGWNTMLVDGRWEPTFTNARYLLGRNGRIGRSRKTNSRAIRSRIRCGRWLKRSWPISSRIITG